MIPAERHSPTRRRFPPDFLDRFRHRFCSVRRLASLLLCLAIIWRSDHASTAAMLLDAWLLAVGGADGRRPRYAQQSVNFYLGGFVPHGEDARVDGDVLVGTDLGLPGVRHRATSTGGTIGGEWLVGAGRVRRGRPRRRLLLSRRCRASTPSSSNDNGSEIEQDLKLRIVPFTATIRFLPLGRRAPVAAVHRRRRGRLRLALQRDAASSSTSTTTASSATASSDSGAATGPVSSAACSVPIGPLRSSAVEVRYQTAKGDLPARPGLRRDRRSISAGSTTSSTFNVRF